MTRDNAWPSLLAVAASALVFVCVALGACAAWETITGPIDSGGIVPSEPASVAGPQPSDPQGTTNACDDALKELERALERVRRACPVGDVFGAGEAL